GGAQTASATVNLTINPVNDPPALVRTSAALFYTENDGPVSVDSTLIVDDVDNVNLQGATISIAGYVAGEDVLTFVDQSGITGSWDATAGVLTLTGTASLAAYQAALRSVTYANTSDNPSTALRFLNFTATDGSAQGTMQRPIVIDPVNDAPTATPIPPVEVLEDAPPTTVNLRSFFSDAEDATEQ